MKELTEEGKHKIIDIATSYALSSDAIMTMLRAVVNGGGSMAQFNIPELGGNGQWMRGGMTMVGDMFNYTLQGTVNRLCNELSNLIASKNIFNETTSKQTGQFSGSWWPAHFGSPSSSGSQNNFRYAYFPPPVSRLVLDINGKQTVYDTLHYHISGVSQQQGGGNSYLFTSQQGPVDVHNLPVISDLDKSKTSIDEMPKIKTAEPAGSDNNIEQINSPSETVSISSNDDIFTTLERLANLKEKGFVTEEEFNAKKTELLKRL